MPQTRPPRDLSDELLSDKCRDFTEFQVWPLKTKLNPERWLGNFASGEMIFAKHLLNGFMYFSEALTRQLFTSAVQNLSMRLTGAGSLPDRWRDFLDTATFTYVTGETPSPADSGFMFARMARDLIPVPETRVKMTPIAVQQVVDGSATSLIFVDDFVGSGNQFCQTWERRYDTTEGPLSLRELEVDGRTPPTYYCPPVCTQYGLENIAARCPSVIVSAGNLLNRRYSVFDPDSVVWPEELRVSGPEFVRTKSAEIGIPDDHGVWDFRGFHELGLCLGFAHKVPDATIPLFRWSSSDWHPLIDEGQ